jgi:alpha-galactosidase
MPDASEHLLAVFRLPGGEAQRTIAPAALDPARAYTLSWLGEGRVERAGGAELMARGITFDLPEEGSALVLVRDLDKVTCALRRADKVTS